MFGPYWSEASEKKLSICCARHCFHAIFFAVSHMQNSCACCKEYLAGNHSDNILCTPLLQCLVIRDIICCQCRNYKRRNLNDFSMQASTNTATGTFAPLFKSVSATSWRLLTAAQCRGVVLRASPAFTSHSLQDKRCWSISGDPSEDTAT